MKKILCTLFLFADLYGMTPRDLLNIKNPTEEQVMQVHNDFSQALNQTIKAFEEYNNYTGKDEDKKRELYQNREMLSEKSQRYLIEEITAISRCPSETEQNSAQKFAEALGLDPKNIEIRIIDAESYLDGIYLSGKKRNYFLNWLKESNLEKDRILFTEHLSKIDFPNKFMNENYELLEIKGRTGQNNALRQKVLKMIIDSSKTSDIYRSLMICFFAKMEAIPSICSRYAGGKSLNAIFEGKLSSCNNNGISLSFSDCNLLFRTFLGSNQTIGPFPSGYYAFFLDIYKTFFHECGHFLDFFSYAFEYYGTNKTMKEIASKFFDMSVDREEFKKQKSDTKKEMEEYPASLLDARASIGIDFKSIDDFLEYEEKNLDNPVFQVKMTMSNSLEVWQIFGVSLLNFNGKNVLCINRMSDFALYLKQLLPIRISHAGDELPIRENKDKPFVHYRLPLQVYGSLMDFFGTSLSAYLLQLQYPYGLSSLLMNEYRLLHGANCVTYDAHE